MSSSISPDGSSAMSDRSWRDRPLFQLTLVRAREFLREPEAVFWTFLFPILMTIGLGIAFRSRPEAPAKVAVLRDAPGAGSTAAALAAPPHRIEVQLLDDSAAARALRTGKVALLITPQANGGVQYRFDDTRPEAIAARRIADDALQRAAGRRDPVAVQETRVRERGSRYIDFVVPGLLGMNLLGSGVWGTGFAIVDARRKRLLKRLIATPMSRSQYLASFVLSRLTWLVLEVGLLLGFAVLVFGVPVRGSLLELTVICLLSALSFASIGLLLASRALTVEGVSGLLNLVMLPMWIFSGVFLSSSRFPYVIPPLIRALPLTAVINALRATMLQGATFQAVALELAIITAWLVVSFPLALRMFRWK